MSVEAIYKRKRRAKSADFRLYQAANVRASRARKEADDARAVNRELELAYRAIADLTRWPLRDGYAAARAGQAYDAAASEDWKRGWRLGQPKKVKRHASAPAPLPQLSIRQRRAQVSERVQQAVRHQNRRVATLRKLRKMDTPG